MQVNEHFIVITSLKVRSFVMLFHCSCAYVTYMKTSLHREESSFTRTGLDGFAAMFGLFFNPMLYVHAIFIRF